VRFFFGEFLTTMNEINTSNKHRFLLTPQYLVGIVVLVASIIFALIMSRTEAILAPLWLLAMAAGFTLQRSRFCFASAFRDLFLFGSARTMKAILLGLAIATIGFAIIMHSKISGASAGFGYFPDEAHILPVGISTIIAGLLFGFGMVISGGCVSGSLYRMAEGYLGSWVVIGGVLIGIGLLNHTWNWWWNTIISNEPRIWLPAINGFGYSIGIFVTLLSLFGIYLLVVWWESRAGMFMPVHSTEQKPVETFSEKIDSLWNTVFVNGWPVAVGGSVLAVIVILMYMVHMPWGVTGDLARLTSVIMTSLSISPPEALGLGDMGCFSGDGTSGLFSHTFTSTVGLLPGALIGALFAKEFKIRRPRKATRYIQSLGGGIIMGYGAGLGFGCTIGAFFSAIPSLSLSGWIFGLAIAGGSFIGVQAIKRIP
jgi:uncharacterized membrane protein YedE/YeeE